MIYFGNFLLIFQRFDKIYQPTGYFVRKSLRFCFDEHPYDRLRAGWPDKYPAAVRQTRLLLFDLIFKALVGHYGVLFFRSAFKRVTRHHLREKRYVAYQFRRCFTRGR